ncbi:hypothetical protein P8452_72476 [Trifolium repens]|nr:hypothetical protein P8452_72476 [Trifolium repens]
MLFLIAPLFIKFLVFCHTSVHSIKWCLSPFRRRVSVVDLLPPCRWIWVFMEDGSDLGSVGSDLVGGFQCSIFPADVVSEGCVWSWCCADDSGGGL